MFSLFSLSKSATSVWLGISEGLLLAFGALLVIGLVGEYSKSDRWKRFVRTFELMVIIGVAGELLADGGIFLLSGRLKTLADIDVAQLNKDAADARSAQEAVEIELSKQRERTATAESALLKLKESLKDRTISADQREKVIKILKGGPSGTVEIVWLSSEPDSYAPAMEIEGIIKAADWIDPEVIPGQSATAIGQGIIVHDTKTAPPCAAVLRKAFSSVGFELYAGEDPTFPNGRVRIWIGRKTICPVRLRKHAGCRTLRFLKGAGFDVALFNTSRPRKPHRNRCHLWSLR